MSSSNQLKLPEPISNLFALSSVGSDSDRNSNKEGITSYTNMLSYLDIQKNTHAPYIQKIKMSYLNSIISAPSANIDNQQRIAYKSSIDINAIDKLVNLSVFKSPPSTNNLFNNYNNKKNSLLKSRAKENEMLPSNNSLPSYRNNSTKPQSSFKSTYNASGASYMDTRPVYLKRKNMNNYDEEEDDDVSDGQPNYSNSIYNINRKKKKKNNRYNKRNIEEEEEDEDYLEEVSKKRNQQCIGFQSAITITNKVLKNNKVSSDYLNDNNGEQQYSNNAGGGGYKKFVPPLKSNSTMKQNVQGTSNNDDPNKDKELDEKLKGFDKKMIEFIESEILTTSPNVNWDDIAGLEFAKKTIKEIIIWPLMRPDLFNGIRRPPKGLLLFGPPGTGKTMIAKAIASQSHSHFFNISASSLMSKWVGESEKLVRTLFALASYYQPSVVFIDEIDSILTARSENECESSRRIKTEFLVQLDGAGTNADDRILIIGATNRPQEIDDAFIRRLSKRLYIPLPNKESRKQLIKNVLTKEKEKNNKYDIEDKDIDEIVELTKGYSGSDMINVCREAAMMPIRSIEDISNLQLEHLRGVNKSDFIHSVENVKPSVSDKTIGQYIEWNKEFGSFQFEEKAE